MYRICLDLDGVICELKKEGQTYEELLPRSGAIEKIKKLKSEGCYIIIQTARHMKTCEGNLGKVMARISAVTLDWLNKYEIPYDEIYFGKPWADIYIDDNGFRFSDWVEFPETYTDLPKSKEKSK
jgi:capsule biosynthesis phosphatase